MKQARLIPGKYYYLKGWSEDWFIKFLYSDNEWLYYEDNRKVLSKTNLTLSWIKTEVE